MSSLAAVGLLLIGAYLVGAVPFGYLVGRARGVDLFAAGSGNIGATNAARVLGTPFGVLVFVLDFLKGAVPVAVAVPLVPAEAGPGPEIVRVGAAAAAFVGHLFPVYLGFRGGKGVATGAGTVCVLAPEAAVVALVTWGLVLVAARTVSVASLAAVTALVVAHLTTTPRPFAPPTWPVTGYLVAGAVLVVVKHRANVRRIMNGTEPASLGDGPRRRVVVRGLHLVALGLWFGGAAFFNFVTAPTIFDSFRQVVAAGPSDRTAGETIIAPDAPAPRKEALASALAGSAVGPVFPRYFALQAVCGVVAGVTAAGTWRYGGVYRLRLVLIGLGVLTVAAGWPLSEYVGLLRAERYAADAAVAEAARAAFGPWHLASLALSGVTVALAGAALVLYRDPPPGPPGS